MTSHSPALNDSSNKGTGNSIIGDKNYMSFKYSYHMTCTLYTNDKSHRSCKTTSTEI